MPRAGRHFPRRASGIGRAGFILMVGTFFVVLAPSWAAAPMQERGLVLIRNATLLPMAEGQPAVVEAQAIVLRGDTILWVGPDREHPPTPAATVVDARGKYVMPGLVDMHVHMAESHLPLFLANGVTTVRELNGSGTHLALRRRIADGELVGPRMFVSSPLLTGRSWSVRHVIVPAPDSARTLVESLAAEGYDWVKIYDDLSAETYAALVETARAEGIPITGHIPEAVGLEGVLAAGQDLEHVEKITWATVGMRPDPDRIPAVVDAVSAAGVRLTATLWSQRIMTAAGTFEYDSLFARPEVRFVSEGTRGWWSSLRRPQPHRQDPEGRGARLHAWQRDLVIALHAAGVPILLGTDTPNPLLVPGFSVHDEIAALIDAGMPVLDVLRSGTSVAGEALGLPGELGVIQPGARADLILLSGNPLADPSHLRKPEVVIAGGRVFEAGALADLLERSAPPESRR